MNDDSHFMQRALELARRGAGAVSPNPMVGAVIVRDGKIIGEGWHEKFGAAHAEVNAVKNTVESVRNTTLYVTLEPCSYHGKTPACAPMLVREGFRRVVIGMIDPNPHVSGDGIRILQTAGIEVTTGIEEKATRQLNQPFIKSMKEGLPYLILKSAITLDGLIADDQGNSKWISSKESREWVHHWRSEYDAVMVGANTVITDNPRLTVRIVYGRNPKRIIVDPNGRTPIEAEIVRSAGEIDTFIIIRESSWSISPLNSTALKPLLFTEKVLPWEKILQQLHQKGIISILVEGGSLVQNSLLNDGYVDRVELFICPKILGGGIRMMQFPIMSMAAAERFISYRWRTVGDDMLFSGIVKEY